MQWSFRGDLLEPATQDQDASVEFAAILAQLSQAVQKGIEEADLDRLAESGRLLLAEGMGSSHQCLRFWFLLGCCYNKRARWKESLTSFDACEQLLQPTDHLAALLVYHHWATAAQNAHQFEVAIRCFEHLIAIWETFIQQRRTDCLAEDARAYLCNLYEQLAGCWLMLGSFTVACSLLEEHAAKLLADAVPTLLTPPYLPAPTQSERNWRELQMFIPWYVNQVISWQARLADDPTSFETDLFRSTVNMLDAARSSEIMPECWQWIASLYTAAAETELQRFRMVCLRDQQVLICKQARGYLEQACRRSKRRGSFKIDRLRWLMLELPQYELRYCELLLEGNFLVVDLLQRDLFALQQQAQQDSAPGYQILAARCAWLQGNIEAQRRSPTARFLARSWYHQALDLISGSEEFTTLIEKGILADIKRLG